MNYMIIKMCLKGEEFMEMGIGILLYLLPIILLAFVIRWIREIKINSEEQVRQNLKLIEILEEIKKNKT